MDAILWSAILNSPQAPDREFMKSKFCFERKNFVSKERILFRKYKNNSFFKENDFIPKQYSIFQTQAEKQNWESFVFYLKDLFSI